MDHLNINALNIELKYEDILKYINLKNLNEIQVDYLLFNLLNLFNSENIQYRKPNLIDYLVKNNHSKISKRLFQIFLWFRKTSDIFEDIDVFEEIVDSNSYCNINDSKTNVNFYINMIYMISYLSKDAVTRNNYDFLIDTPDEFKKLSGEGDRDIAPNVFYQLFQKYPEKRDYLIIFIVFLFIYMEFGEIEYSESIIGYLHIFKDYIKESNNLELIKEELFAIILDSINNDEIKDYFANNEILDPTVDINDPDVNNKKLKPSTLLSDRWLHYINLSYYVKLTITINVLLQSTSTVF